MAFSWTEFAESKDGEYVAKTINLIKLLGSPENPKVEFNGKADVGYWRYTGVIFGHVDLDKIEHVMIVEFRSKRHALLEIREDLYELLPSDHVIYKENAFWRPRGIGAPRVMVHQHENPIVMQFLERPCPSKRPKKRVWMELTKQREDLTKKEKRRRWF